MHLHRTCPLCSKEIAYQTEKSYACAVALETRCFTCIGKHGIDKNKELTALCAQCNKIRTFTNRDTWWEYTTKAIALQLCQSCYYERKAAIAEESECETIIKKKWINSVKERDAHMCQSCGLSDNLHIHHIKMTSKHPFLSAVVSNGITLCVICHASKNGVHGNDEPLNEVIRDLRAKSLD